MLECPADEAATRIAAATGKRGCDVVFEVAGVVRHGRRRHYFVHCRCVFSIKSHYGNTQAGA